MMSGIDRYVSSEQMRCSRGRRCAAYAAARTVLQFLFTGMDRLARRGPVSRQMLASMTCEVWVNSLSCRSGSMILRGTSTVLGSAFLRLII